MILIIFQRNIELIPYKIDKIIFRFYIIKTYCLSFYIFFFRGKNK